MRFEFATATRIIFGEGMAATLPDLARTVGARPFVVTGASRERARALVSALSAEAFAVSGEPTVDLVREGARHAQDAACDVVISIGGGSVIDAGKAIAILATNGGEPLEFIEIVGKGSAITVPPLPFIAVPTTAGTGADVSQFCIITDTASAVKMTIMGRALVPDISVTDARLLSTMPEDLAAAIDAAVRPLYALAKKDPKLKIMAVVERELIARALIETNGNQVQAARLLGITRATLRKRIDKFRIAKRLEVK